MLETFNEIANNTTLLIVGAYLGGVVTIILVVLLFIKSSRDERGRAIIGKASIISTIIFIILTNCMATAMSYIEINYVVMGNCIQWIYDIVIISEGVAIMVLKKIS